MSVLLPKYRVYSLDLSKPFPSGWNYIGCVCEFADECQMTYEDLAGGVKCKASQAYQSNKRRQVNDY